MYMQNFVFTKKNLDFRLLNINEFKTQKNQIFSEIIHACYYESCMSSVF